MSCSIYSTYCTGLNNYLLIEGDWKKVLTTHSFLSQKYTQPTKLLVKYMYLHVHTTLEDKGV